MKLKENLSRKEVSALVEAVRNHPELSAMSFGRTKDNGQYYVFAGKNLIRGEMLTFFENPENVERVIGIIGSNYAKLTKFESGENINKYAQQRVIFVQLCEADYSKPKPKA